jgi:S1-C subfamily serine protease
MVAGGIYLSRPFERKVQGEISEQGVTDYSDEEEISDTEEDKETEPWVYTSADRDIAGIDKTTLRFAYGIKELKSENIGLLFKPKFPNDKDANPDLLPTEYYKSMVTILGYEGHGSGFVFNIDEYGNALIMTNAHVMDQNSPVFVVLTYEGELLKVSNYDIDLGRDLAILEVHSTKLKAFPVAAQKAGIGESVIAIGTPGRSINTVNFGKIIDKGQRVSIDYGKNKKRSVEFAQIDAKVKEGNSGGPLLNNKGEIVGVICCVYKNKNRSGFIDYRNMIFRINDYKNHGYFTKESLGIEVALQEKDTLLGIPKDGYKITYIDNFGVGEKYGLVTGDIITKINNFPVEMDKKNADYLLKVMDDSLGNSDPLIIDVLRNEGRNYEPKTVVVRVR